MRPLKTALIILFLLFVLAAPTKAYFSANAQTTSNQFTAGDWISPTIQLEALSAFSNSSNLTINYSASDSASLIDVVYLYGRYAGGNWSLLLTEDITPNQQSASGSFSYTADQGDGLYEFFAAAKDTSGNLEDTPTVQAFTTLDTVAPSTSLSVNSSHEINQALTNGDFEQGITGWDREGDVIIISGDDYEASAYEGIYMARIGTPEAYAGEKSGNSIWTNKLTQRLEPGAKNLSFYYNFYSFDTSGFDNPAIYVKLNDYAVFTLTASEIDTGGNPNQTGWQQASFNLEGITDPLLEIIFYSGNTGDDSSQSWVYLDNITTATAQVKDSSTFSLSASDSGSGVLDTQYSFDGMTWHSGSSFVATDLSSGTNTVYFRSRDNAGNQELAKQRIITKNNTAPDAIIDLTAFATSKHTIELDWTAPGDNNGIDQASVYDIRYSTVPIVTAADFAAATPVNNPLAPRLPGELETFTVAGLDSSTTYFLAVKSGDAVTNWSDMSNVVSATTLDEISDPFVNYGDVVINELMWMGTTLSAADEFLELRNMTDQDIDLTDWTISGAGTSGSTLTLPLGAVIPAHGYFLITNFDPTDPLSQLSETTVIPDWITTSLALYNSDIQLILQDDSGFTIDIADDGVGPPFAGLYDSTNSFYYSMERNHQPGDGTQASNWHTIFADSAEMQAYWDSGALEKGTPGGRNLSQFPAQISTPIIASSSSLPHFSEQILDNPIISTDSATVSAEISSQPPVQIIKLEEESATSSAAIVSLEDNQSASPSAAVSAEPALTATESGQFETAPNNETIN